MSESPRWLITNQRYDRVYKILFRQPSHYQIQPAVAVPSQVASDKKSVSAKSLKHMYLHQ